MFHVDASLCRVPRLFAPLPLDRDCRLPAGPATPFDVSKRRQQREVVPAFQRAACPQRRSQP
ncbi:hypothetical protein NX871_30900, partial [Burkholderia thailandensis]|uniref:hypothetical protein n=1 Tax=Burkholderia thailandensis TaxID=57975 RepID=UPI00217EF827